VYIEDVVIHEFGHALGLGHSDVPDTTMEPSMSGYCDTSQLTLEADDISGIRSLYPPTASSSSGQAPATPSGLVASVNATSPTSSIALSWADNANNETGYSVERSTDGRSFTPIAQIGGNTGAWTDGGLNGGTMYYYRVRAFNGSGNSAYSNTASAQTQTGAASTAPTVAISSPSSRSSYASGAVVNFSGSANDAADGNLTGGIQWTSNVDGPIGSGGSFSRVLSSGVHTITANVTDSAGLMASTQVTITVSAPAVSSTPTTSGVTLTARGYKVKGNQTVDLAWSGLSGGSVDIYRNGSVISSTANDGAETDRINKKGGGATYTYQVCEGGTSTCSNSVSVSF
jgi:hypothetical protein